MPTEATVTAADAATAEKIAEEKTAEEKTVARETAAPAPAYTFAGGPSLPAEDDTLDLGNIVLDAPADPAVALRDAEVRVVEAEVRSVKAEARAVEAEARFAEEHEALLRSRAETENVRRRAQEDVAKASKFAAEKFAGAMLPVKDSLEAALAIENQTLEKLREGVELTLKQLVAAFEGTNLTEENPLGRKFDPNWHQAIGTVESDAEPNTVVTVLQKGYLLHGRVIRPAMVMVARAKS
ncbi:MAG: nucleotide exchange factor GrpE [Azoarcus sp.]|jgi:molecular chaperone GrpE|nr:nucleotide exchange factor GrpE [Azoarcus sp.]